MKLQLIPCALAALASIAGAQDTARITRDVGFDQRLGAQVPLDIELVDEAGRTVRLGDLLGRKPVVLTLVYYECPMLCTEVLSGLVHALRAVSLEPGADFDLVTVSIDPRETPALAAAKKANCVADYGRAGAGEAWRFLTGREDAVRRLAGSVGFRYVFDEGSQQYAHAAGFVVLTPAGRVSRCFYGIEYPPGDLRLALVESADERIGSLVDQILLLCWHYDPATGRYGFAIVNAIRAGGLLTVAAIAVFTFVMLRRERRALRRPRAEGGS